jgi:hypothetical protein
MDLAQEVGPGPGRRRPAGGSGGQRGANLPVTARVVEQLALTLGGELLGDCRVEHHRVLLAWLITSTFWLRSRAPHRASDLRFSSALAQN